MGVLNEFLYSHTRGTLSERRGEYFDKYSCDRMKSDTLLD